MAVYTQVSREQLIEFLKDYDLGALISHEGIQQGVENTNYVVYTDAGRFILTLFEKRTKREDLPFFFAFTDHLTKKGIKCPQGIPAKDGQVIRQLAERPAVLISFLDGKELPAHMISPDYCRQLGVAVAFLHKSAEDFPLKRENSMSIPAWQALMAKTRDKADGVQAGLRDYLETELGYIAHSLPQLVQTLPRAVVHADIFPDNVFFKTEEVYGFLDFYFSCTDFLTYDLALVINAWCFDAQNKFVPERFKALIEGYEAIRPLSEDEKETLSLLCRAAALRITMTRLHDWVFHDPANFVKPKNPLEYVEKLKFHQNERIGS